jgi:uncharacterized protein YndB with AHSA1/START domain
MSTTKSARAVADIDEGLILATVTIAMPPDRVFRALTSDEVVKWWGSDQVYRVTNWTSDLRVGGSWRSEGKGADGAPFSVEGEYLEIDPPHKLVQTWSYDWDERHVTKLTYQLQPTSEGTKLTVRHEGFKDRPEACGSHSDGWEMVLSWLHAYLVPTATLTPSKYFFCRLMPPRSAFAFDMTDEECAIMLEHGGYWREQMRRGNVVVFGPVADPEGPWGLGVVKAQSDDEVKAFGAADPAIQSGRGFSYRVLPMLQAVTSA